MTTIDTNIPVFSNPINRDTQTPSEISQAGDDTIAEFPIITNKINTVSGQMNTVSGEVNSYKVDAETAKIGAETAQSNTESARDIAQASANFKGVWSDLTGALNIPATVYHEGITYQLLTNLADVTLSEPSGSNSDWVGIDGVVPTMSVGNIQSLLYHLPLKNSLVPLQGVGSVTFNRAGAATHTNRYGVVIYLASGEEGYDVDGINLPPASTNKLVYSQEFDNDPAWTKTRSSISANLINGPDGTLTADKLVEDDTVTATHSVNKSFSSTSGETYAFSIYIKAGERTNFAIQLSPDAFGATQRARFNLSTGEATIESGEAATALINPLADDWFRCVIICTATATTTSVFLFYLHDGTSTSYTGDGSSGLYIWGAQLEELPFATPYIPTTSAPVARLAANITFPYAENFPGSLKDKTVIFDVNVIGTSAANASAFSTDDLIFYISGTAANNGDTSVYMATGSETTDVSKTGSFRFGMTYNAATTTLRMYHNGILVAEDTSATATDAAAATVTLGSADAYIKLKNLKKFDETRTEQEMRLL